MGLGIVIVGFSSEGIVEGGAELVPLMRPILL